MVTTPSKSKLEKPATKGKSWQKPTFFYPHKRTNVRREHSFATADFQDLPVEEKFTKQ